MLDILLHLDKQAWTRIVSQFKQFDLASACKRTNTQIEHIKQDPIVKGKHLIKLCISD